jgi:hypothetical protein
LKHNKVGENSGNLSMTKDEVERMAKCTFFIEKIKKYQDQNHGLFDELSKFLIKICNECLQIVQ